MISSTTTMMVRGEGRGFAHHDDECEGRVDEDRGEGRRVIQEDDGKDIGHIVCDRLSYAARTLF